MTTFPQIEIGSASVPIAYVILIQTLIDQTLDLIFEY